jgi:hypothetical protein
MNFCMPHPSNTNSYFRYCHLLSFLMRISSSQRALGWQVWHSLPTPHTQRKIIALFHLLKEFFSPCFLSRNSNIAWFSCTKHSTVILILYCGNFSEAPYDVEINHSFSTDGNMGSPSLNDLPLGHAVYTWQTWDLNPGDKFDFKAKFLTWCFKASTLKREFVF